MNNTALLSTAYFGPIQYFTKIVWYENILIEQFENFSKQSYRNRCEILGSNGRLTLSIPTKKSTSLKVLMKDTQISYDMDWQTNHWRSIVSAYNRSPFFEYYADDIKPLFESKTKYLVDLNHQILELIFELLQTDYFKRIKNTEDYIVDLDSCDDYRANIHPKNRMQKEDLLFNQNVKYTQVFSDKQGFVNNLSILDLLFNEGPNTLNTLKTYIKI